MAERIFYATHFVKLGGAVLKGVQSVSLTSNFGLEPVFQLGQCSHVEVVPSVPECEVTITRSIIGGPAITLDLSNDCTSAEEILNVQQDIEIVSDAGGFIVQNAYLSGYSVNFDVEGVFTEEISYVGDSIISGGSGFTAQNDQVHLPRRQDWTGPSGATSASLSLDIGREAVYVLGEYQPIKRFVQFPVEVSLDIGYLLPEGGGLGVQDPPNCQIWTEGKQNFSISACNTTWLIREAYLSNIGYSGGDVGGGNVEVTYTYSSWSNCSIG
jgi:hypothetical protein